MSMLQSGRGTIPPENLLTDVLVRVRVGVDAPSGYNGSSPGADTPATITPVDVATTGNVTLSGLQTIDGVAGADGLRVWARAQTDQTQNRLYLMRSGSWDLLTSDIAPELTVRVASGATLTGTRGVITNAAAPVVGTDNIAWEFQLVGSGTTSRLARFSSAGRLAASSLVTDDGARVQINSSDTTGVLNVSRSSSAATLYARNAGIGVAVLGQSDGATGIAVEGFASGGGGHGVYGHASGGYGVWGAAGNGGTGGYFENTGTGGALVVYANSTTATSAVAEVNQHAGGNAARTALTVTQAGTGTGVGIDAVGIGLSITATGTVQAGKAVRNVAGATQAVWDLQQNAAGNGQPALRITQASTQTGAIISAVEVTSTGTDVVGVRADSAAGFSFGAFYSAGFLKGYRDGAYAGAGIDLILDNASDTGAAISVRHDGSGALFKGNMAGTGNLLQLQDNGTDVLRIPDGGASIFGVGAARPFAVLTGSTTLTAAHWHARAATGAGAITLTLPSAPEHGRYYLISRTGANNLTLSRGGSDTINGGNTQAIGNGALWLVQYNSSTTDWYAIQIG